LRDEAQGANSRASLDGLPEFATQRIARKTTARKGSAKNGRLAHLLACVCHRHTLRQAGTPSIPFLIRTRMAGVIQSMPKASIPIFRTAQHLSFKPAKRSTPAIAFVEQSPITPRK